MLINKKKKRFKDYVEQISEVLMKRTSIDEGIDSLVNKYIDDALSDENVFAAFKSKQKTTQLK